jgi:uncharacterized membrane protein
MRLFVQWLSVLGVITVLDGLWLGLIARSFYQNQLGPLMRDTVFWPAAIVFYLLYPLGLVLLALGPADRGGGWPMALGLGAIVGLVAYGTYDLTNLATLKGFTPTLAVVDLIWGTVLSATAAALGWLISARILG